MLINDSLNVNGKRILIVGNRGQKNLGDELILLGTIKLLGKQNKKIFVSAPDKSWLRGFFHQFTLRHNKSSKLSESFYDVEGIPPTGENVSTNKVKGLHISKAEWCAELPRIKFVFELPKGFRSFVSFWIKGKFKDLVRYFAIDAVIIGGGEILTEESRSAYRYRIAAILPCLIKKIFRPVHIYIMGGIQVPHKKINRLLFNFLLSKTTKILARDMDSVNELKNNGFENVEFFMDTSYFAYERNKIKNEELRVKNLTGNLQPATGNYIVVNLNKNGAHFIDDIVNDIKEYLVKGYKVYFVPMAKGRGGEYMDITYYYKIKNALGEFETLNLGDFLILDWEHDFNEFVMKLSGAEMVISSRLHLFLISEFMGLQTQVYPYQKKILKMKKVVEEISC